MTRAARRRVQDEFSIGAVARRHLELFESLVEGRLRRVGGAKRNPPNVSR
jgi:hypothetical protein